MKDFVMISVLIGVCFSAAMLGQNDAEIAGIRAEVAAINRDARKYSVTKKDVEDISLEGTEAIYYAADGRVKKIVAKIYGETFNAVGEFFFKEDRLIFAFLKHNRYDTQIGLAKPPKIAKSEEKRFYFVNEVLIRFLIGKSELKPSDPRFNETRDEIVEIVTRLKEAYN